MNINRLQKNTLLLLIVPLLCAGLGSCQREEFVGMEDREALVREGKYLSASRAAELGDPDPSAGTVGSNFAEGTPYRMVVVSGNQDEMDGTNQRANHIRMNGVVKEARSGSIPYIDFGVDAVKCLSFAPTPDEEQKRKALDFYGFTYGTPENAETDYLQLNATTGENNNDYTTLYREETVTDNVLNDLLYGQLLNQRAATVGSSAQIPFRHAFSQLRFQALQTEGQNDGAATGQGLHDIQITGITVTGTYRTGKVFLSDGKVQVSSQANDGLPLKLDGDGKEADRVGIVSKDYGIMTILPSEAGSLRDTEGDGNITNEGYKLGLQVTIKGDQTGVKTYCGESATQIGETDRYTGTIKIETINNNLANNTEAAGTAPLYLKAGYSYLLRLSFMDNRFLITVVQQVAEWIPGENQFASGDDGLDSQMQQIGQPIYFDGKLWLDRNLGADDYDAENGKFEHTVGYFYQQFRNIPYWPYRLQDYGNGSGRPLPGDKRKQSLNEYNNYKLTSFNVFPMVSFGLLNCTDVFEMNNSWYDYNTDKTYNEEPQAYQKYAISDIPEDQQVQQWKSTKRKYTFAFARHYQPIDWNNVKNQPVPQGYRIPTAEEFRSIFPTTPLAGNFGFIGGGNCSTPSSWGPKDNNDQPTVAFLASDIKTIRICVPYYSLDGEPDKDKETAWNHWKKIEAPLPETERGCWPTDESYRYNVDKIGTGCGPGKNVNRNVEPKGDPAPGYCSVYVISREENHEHKIEDNYPGGGTVPPNLQNFLQLKKWGTIYGIKKVGTSEAYRMRWTVNCRWEQTQSAVNTFPNKGSLHPLFYVRIDRYRCSASDNLTRENYKTYQWDNPVATTYFPISGLVESGTENGVFGHFYNCGNECMYATSDTYANPNNEAYNGVVVRLKASAANLRNTYISVVNGERPLYGMQLRLIQD